MPTDLPKNFHGSAPKANGPSPLRGLWHMIWHHWAPPVAYEYSICYLLTGVASSTLLGNSFSQPQAALGVMAAGILVRHFTRQPTPPGFALPNQIEMTPADVAAMKEALDGLDLNKPTKVSPYL